MIAVALAHLNSNVCFFRCDGEGKQYTDACKLRYAFSSFFWYTEERLDLVRLEDTSSVGKTVFQKKNLKKKKHSHSLDCRRIT